MIEVVEAKYVSEYKIWVKFSDGKSGEVNLESDLWGPVFEPLKDVKKFREFFVSKTFGTIVWDNEADFAPEHLYHRMQS